MFKLSPHFELFLTSLLKKKSFLQFYDIISNICKFALWSFLFEMRNSSHLQFPVVLVFFSSFGHSYFYMALKNLFKVSSD